MSLFRSSALVLCVALFVPPARGQRLTILIDPARGGAEAGARIDEHTTEKQVTLEVANRLRSLLAARDFDVLLTRDADVQVSNDARAAMANQAKPIACILVHATAAGRGLHLFTSALPQAAPEGYAVPWDDAQGLYALRSERLVSELATAFGRSKIPVSSGRTWIRPLDNMECPAVAVEIAPNGGGDTAADRGYQNRIADTIAGAMLFWRGHADIVQSILTPPVAGPGANLTSPVAGPGAKPAGTVAEPSRATVPGAVPAKAGGTTVVGGTAAVPVTRPKKEPSVAAPVGAAAVGNGTPRAAPTTPKTMPAAPKTTPTTPKAMPATPKAVPATPKATPATPKAAPATPRVAPTPSGVPE